MNEFGGEREANLRTKTDRGVQNTKTDTVENEIESEE